MNIQMNAASSSMRELQKKIDMIANNVANVNTTGYKKQEANFADTLLHSVNKQAGPANEIGRSTPNGLRIGGGTLLSDGVTRHSLGQMQQTGRELDFAIDSPNSYFRVSNEDGISYTRNGSFQTEPIAGSDRLALVTASGDSVLGADGTPITLAAGYDELNIGSNGTVTATYAGQAAETFQFGTAQINRTALLEKAGDNRYRLPGTEAEQIAAGALELGGSPISQAVLETSNVDMASEMTELIATQRLFQSQGRAISFADDMMGLVNTMKS